MEVKKESADLNIFVIDSYVDGVLAEVIKNVYSTSGQKQLEGQIHHVITEIINSVN